ncbi:MAG: magnesium-translocating P-type ATPase [Gaiellaceae bacterium]
MKRHFETPHASTAEPQELELSATATLPVADVLRRVGSSDVGLSSAEAGRRLGIYGPNVLAAHGVSAWAVLARQLRSYLLLLLFVAAVVSAVVGDLTEALIIGAIMAMSIGLSFFNEYRSEQAVEELHSEIKHLAAVDRDGAPAEIAVTQLVPGDVVHLRVGDVIPADLRLLEVHELECDESVLTGESRAADKTAEAQPPGDSPLDLRSCVFMGTLVSGGGGRGVVVRTGSRTAFGAIAVRLGERQGVTAFQQGLQDFSRLLATVTAVLAGSIFLINAALGRSILQSALFALAIAVGLTPQLLPAIVTVSLSTGARRLAKKSVIVKRLVAIEDLGNVQVLFTDKTGTLTQGQISFTQALGGTGKPDKHVHELGLACADKTGNELDRALWAAPQDADGDTVSTPLDRLPFDHERQLTSVLADTHQGRMLISKGAPEAVLARCTTVPAQAQATLDELFASGTRVVAVACRTLAADHLSKDDERDLSLEGFLCFTDPVKPDVKDSLARLARLGITVKIVTGDNGQVAAHLCGEVGLDHGTVVTGQEIEKLDDDALVALLPTTTIFARVTPEQKSRIILAQRSLGSDVAFLGDGVNDAIALHHADVGISVESAADVAKDAAAIVLLDKDLSILADGVVEGRRIFANTIKYVLMGTSSNFGNMFSAAGASLFLSFLPMLPTQILLNNLLYDVSEITIPTDNVDEEQLQRPAHWDTAFIRRFMTFFGPISSIFDFATFGIMIWVFNAHAPLFRSGWFVESLATQSLIIFAIRTRRVPFFHSRPSTPLALATVTCVTIGVLLPFSPLAHVLGFVALPAGFLAALAVMIVIYLVLVELGKLRFYRVRPHGPPVARRRPDREHWIHHRATRWSIPGRPRRPMAAHRP